MSSSASKRLRRGEIVDYDDNLYFCQPNGTFCYLYNHPHDIGILARAIHMVRVSDVSKVDRERVRIFYSHLPMTSKKGTSKTT
jgi:hypothetical protein